MVTGLEEAKSWFNSLKNFPFSTVKSFSFIECLHHHLTVCFRQGCCCCCCCCCSVYLSSCQRTASDANLLDGPHTFHYNDYFVLGGIRTCLGVSDDPMFLWISSNSCPLNLLLVRSHQAEIIVVKRLIQGCNNVTRVGVEPTPFDQGRRKNDASTHSATLPTYSFGHAADKVKRKQPTNNAWIL